MKLRVRPILTLGLSVFLKWTLPNVFSTLQSKRGGGINFFLLYYHGHFKVLIYLFPSTCPLFPPPFVAAAQSMSARGQGQLLHAMLGLKDTADNPSSCKSVGHVAEVKQPLRSQANGTSEGALFQPKKHKHAHRTIRPGKPAGLCTRCKMSSCLETLLHGEGGLSTHKVFQLTQLHCMILNDLMNNGTGREGWCIG